MEAFGWAALLLPAAIAYWTLYPVGRPRGWRYAAQTAALLTLAAAWAGQWAPEPGLGLASAGLVGWSGGSWVRSTLGGGLGFGLLTAGLALSLWHQLYAPGLRSALKDVRAAGRLFTREGAAEARAWLIARLADAGGVRRNVVAVVVLAPVQVLGAVMLAAGGALRRGAIAPLGVLLGARLGALASRLRGGAASLRHIKARRRERPLPPRHASSRASARGDAQTAPDGSAFDGWLLDEEPPARGADLRAPERRGIEPSPDAGRGVAGQRGQPSGVPRDEFVRPWEHPADASLDEAKLWTPDAPSADDAGRAATPSAPTGAERIADALRSAQEMRGDRPDSMPSDSGLPGRPAPRSPAPELPPAGAGRERWEQLLRRYRENLDLDWDEHGWRAKEEPGAPDGGPGDAAAKPRGSK